MQQIAVRGVNLDHVKARKQSATRCLRESFDDFVDSRFVEFPRLLVMRRKWNRAGRYHFIPAALFHTHDSLSHPRRTHARFTSRVRKLDSGKCSLIMQKIDDSFQRNDMLVFPQPKVARA